MLLLQVQERGMLSLCAAFRSLDTAVAGQLLGLHYLRLESCDALLITLNKAVAVRGNMRARAVLAQWQVQTDMAKLTFRH